MAMSKGEWAMLLGLGVVLVFASHDPMADKRTYPKALPPKEPTPPPGGGPVPEPPKSAP